MYQKLGLVVRSKLFRPIIQLCWKEEVRIIPDAYGIKLTFLEPEQPEYIESLDSIVRADHWSEE